MHTRLLRNALFCRFVVIAFSFSGGIVLPADQTSDKKNPDQLRDELSGYLKKYTDAWGYVDDDALKKVHTALKNLPDTGADDFAPSSCVLWLTEATPSGYDIDGVPLGEAVPSKPDQGDPYATIGTKYNAKSIIQLSVFPRAPSYDRTDTNKLIIEFSSPVIREKFDRALASLIASCTN